MEKFFDTMELSDEEIAKGLKLGVRDGSVARAHPVSAR